MIRSGWNRPKPLMSGVVFCDGPIAVPKVRTPSSSRRMGAIRALDFDHLKSVMVSPVLVDLRTSTGPTT